MTTDDEASRIAQQWRDSEGLQHVEPDRIPSLLPEVSDTKPGFYRSSTNNNSANYGFPPRIPYIETAWNNLPKERPPVAGKRILGLRRTTFFLTLSNIILAVALIVVGVTESHVLGRRDSSCSTTSSSSTQVSSPSTTSTSSPAPPMPTIPTKNICFATNTTSSTTFIPPQAECPLSGNRYYTVPNSNLTFERLCGTDYPGSDMASFPSSSMADCLAVCAQLNLYPSSSLGPCKGATWVFGNGQGDSPQGQNVSFCYPKYQLPATAQRAGAESAWILGES